MSKKFTLTQAKAIAPEWATHVAISHDRKSCIFESVDYYQSSTPDGFCSDKLKQGDFTIMEISTLLEDID